MSRPRRARSVSILSLTLIIHQVLAAGEAKRISGGIHVPVVRRLASASASNRLRRSVSTGSIGLGDYEDLTYNVLFQVGETHIPVVLDTGSSDLWVLSDSCKGVSCSASKVPQYPLASFRPAQLDAALTYGDSKTGTYARGPIGSDFVSVAGLGLQNQYFVAINSTNTTIIQTDSGGIFGLGFPFNSLVWNNLFQSQNVGSGAVAARDMPRTLVDGNRATSRLPDGIENSGVRWFAKDGNEPGLAGDVGIPLKRSSSTNTTTTALQSSLVSYGPFIPRLVAQGLLDSPMFSIALQRDAIQIGGNEGMLSIGQLPPTVESESLTWVSVRGYPTSQGGLSPPADALGEVYPAAWEIPLDDVWLDGVKLPRSKLSSPYISLSALIDTGNSLIRGPPDVVAHIETILGGKQFACSSPHSLAFQIGGKLFPVDPRDFVSQVYAGDPSVCSANVVATDVPVWGGSGYLYSWNLGDPFLKGVLAAFHYGSLTRPSQNPPRIGLLSTIEFDADKQLCEDERRAKVEHEGFSVIVEPAPSSLSPARGTGIGGVPLAPVPTVTLNVNGSGARLTNGGVGSMYGTADSMISARTWVGALVVCMGWMIRSAIQ